MEKVWRFDLPAKSSGPVEANHVKTRLACFTLRIKSFLIYICENAFCINTKQCGPNRFSSAVAHSRFYYSRSQHISYDHAQIVYFFLPGVVNYDD